MVCQPGSCSFHLQFWFLERGTCNYITLFIITSFHLSCYACISCIISHTLSRSSSFVHSRYVGRWYQCRLNRAALLPTYHYSLKRTLVINFASLWEGFFFMPCRAARTRSFSVGQTLGGVLPREQLRLIPALCFVIAFSPRHCSSVYYLPLFARFLPFLVPFCSIRFLPTSVRETSPPAWDVCYYTITRVFRSITAA